MLCKVLKMYREALKMFRKLLKVSTLLPSLIVKEFPFVFAQGLTLHVHHA